MEVLVSLLILSMMLLSFDALQLKALQSAQVNFLLTAASLQLQSINDVINAHSLTPQIQRLWETQNHRLLPQARSQITTSQASLFWGGYQGADCPKVRAGKSGCMVIQLS